MRRLQGERLSHHLSPAEDLRSAIHAREASAHTRVADPGPILADRGGLCKANPLSGPGTGPGPGFVPPSPRGGRRWGPPARRGEGGTSWTWTCSWTWLQDVLAQILVLEDALEALAHVLGVDGDARGGDV